MTDAFASKPAPTLALCTTQIQCGSGLVREGRNPVHLPAPVRRPVVHPVKAFNCESWLKASPIRIAATTGKRPVANASVWLLERPI